MEVAAELRTQLQAHLTMMYATGAVDAYFQELQELDEGNAGTGYIAEVLNIFLNDGDRILSDIDGLLNKPLHEVEFSKVDALVQQLHILDKWQINMMIMMTWPLLRGDYYRVMRGCYNSYQCQRVGAKKVNLACMEFQQFYVAKNKKGCLMALALLKGDFCDLRNKLQTFMQLEQQIAPLFIM